MQQADPDIGPILRLKLQSEGQPSIETLLRESAEVEAPNIHGSHEEISVLTSPKITEVVPEEESSRKPEGEVPDEQPIAGIPPARYKTPRPKRERRVPIRYRW